MEFFEFIDINFQNKSYENSVKYSIKRDGELQALHMMVGMERKFFKWTAFFKFIFDYFLVLLTFKDEPEKIVPKPTINVPKNLNPQTQTETSTSVN